MPGLYIPRIIACRDKSAQYFSSIYAMPKGYLQSFFLSAALRRVTSWSYEFVRIATYRTSQDRCCTRHYLRRRQREDSVLAAVPGIIYGGGSAKMLFCSG